MQLRRGIDPNTLNNLILIGLLSGRARLPAWCTQPATRLPSPPARFSLFSLNPGLLDPLGGAVVGMIAALIYANRKKLGLLPTLDALTPLLAVMASTAGFGQPGGRQRFRKTHQLAVGYRVVG